MNNNFRVQLLVCVPLLFIASVLIYSPDEHSKYVEYTFKENLQKANNCDIILEKGEWKNFEKTGSWERYNVDSNNRLLVDEQNPQDFRLDAVFYNGKIDRNNQRLSDPKCKKPYRWPVDCTGRPNWGNGFYNWNQQSYSGDWVSTENECQLKRLSETDVAKCFLPTKPVVIGVNGDSVSRQIFLATSMYLEQKVTGFFDQGTFGGVHESEINEHLKVKFHWNETPEPGIRKEPIYEDGNLSLLIIGPKCLHPMFNVFKTKSWDGKDVHPEDLFEKVELPKIRKFLKQKPTGFVYVVAQHYIHRNREDKVSRTYRSYDIIKRYNAKVRELVFTENSTD